MRRRRLAEQLGLGSVLLLTWGAPIGSAYAACGTPDVVDTLPPDGQTLVPTNTSLSASYELGATHQGEPVIVTANPGSRHQLAASYSRALKSLVVTLPNCAGGADPSCLENSDFPGGQLKPNTEYRVEWPGLSADDALRVGQGATVTFGTGPGPDATSPSFAGTRRVRWGFEREFDGCSDTESERYVFDVQISSPTYAGGEELLTMHVFQTVGRLLQKDANDNPVPEEVHRGRYRGGESIRIKQPIATAFGQVCFSAFAEAPNGLISQGSETEACTRTEHPPFFEGCSFGGQSFGKQDARSSGWALWLLAVGLAACARSRSRAASASQKARSKPAPS